MVNKHCRVGWQSKTYKAWASMKSRCNNKNHRAYIYYGGRGITVCERWNEFENFLKDMGEAPKGLTLERKDNNKGYCKDNCKWASWEEQSKNKRNRKEYINNRSGYTGICWHKRDKVWQVNIQVDKKQKHVGNFPTIDDAVNALNKYIG